MSRKPLLSLAASLTSLPPPSARGLDMSRFRQRHIALHVVYLGHDFYGYASQDPGGGDIYGGSGGGGEGGKVGVSALPPQPTAASRKRSRGSGAPAPEAVALEAAGHLNPSLLLTIETLIFGALNKACFVESRGSAGYTRCGRTDKGVSAGGQVLSLRLRSKALRRDAPPPAPPLAKDSPAFCCSSAVNDLGVVAAAAAGGVGREEGGVPAPPPPSSSSTCAASSEPPLDPTLSRTWCRGDGLSNTGDAFPHPSQEHDYALVLNNILPPEIRVLGWADAPDDFSARFSASLRTYRYYFPCRALDLEAMRQAGQRLCQKADFRNMCKIDLAATQNFVREILSVRIVGAGAEEGEGGEGGGDKGGGTRCTSSPPTPFPLFSHSAREAAASADRAYLEGALQHSGGRTMVYLEVVGRAFLWHQIRCVVALLFLVGRGLETPDTVAALLDIERVPARPAYQMAPEGPLVLHHCGFGEEVEEEEGGVGGSGSGKSALGGKVLIEGGSQGGISAPDLLLQGGGIGVGGEGGGIEKEEKGEDDEEGEGRPDRFLRNYPPAALNGSGFYASPAALCKVTAELESQWSALTIKAAMVKGMLDRVNALKVSEGAVHEAMGVVQSTKGSSSSSSASSSSAFCTWGEALEKYGGKAGPLLSLEDTEYNVMLRSRRSGAKLGATPFERGYVPILSRAQGTRVEDRWSSLPEEERAAIVAKHPHNAPRLDEAAGRKG